VIKQEDAPAGQMMVETRLGPREWLVTYLADGVQYMTQLDQHAGTKHRVIDTPRRLRGHHGARRQRDGRGVRPLVMVLTRRPGPYFRASSVVAS